MIQYVLGFMFDVPRRKLLLIRKHRPDWQRGQFNGIGGKVKSGETGLAAMVREFREETGIETITFQWTQVVQIQNPQWTMYVYAASGDSTKARQRTDEPVMIVSMDRLPSDCLPNLFWMVPLCLDRNLRLPILMLDGNMLDRIMEPAPPERGVRKGRPPKGMPVEEEVE